MSRRCLHNVYCICTLNKRFHNVELWSKCETIPSIGYTAAALWKNNFHRFFETGQPLQQACLLERFTGGCEIPKLHVGKIFSIMMRRKYAFVLHILLCLCYTIPLSLASVSEPSSLPSSQPTRQPTEQPSGRPSGQPTSQPSQPTSYPTSRPTAQPVGVPTGQPTSRPTTAKQIQIVIRAEQVAYNFQSSFNLVSRI